MRIAGHIGNHRLIEGAQKDPQAHMGSGSRGFNPSVASANNDDVKIGIHKLTDGAAHIHLDELVELDRVFHRQLFRERFNEAHNNHLGRVFFA